MTEPIESQIFRHKKKVLPHKTNKLYDIYTSMTTSMTNNNRTILIPFYYTMSYLLSDLNTVVLKLAFSQAMLFIASLCAHPDK